MVVFGPNILITLGGSKSCGTHITEKPPRHLVCIVLGRAWDQMGQKKTDIWPKIPVSGQIWIFWTKSHFFVLESRFLFCLFCISSIPGATAFPFGPPQKNFRFRDMGLFSGLTPVFGHFHICLRSGPSGLTPPPHYGLTGCPMKNANKTQIKRK